MVSAFTRCHSERSEESQPSAASGTCTRPQGRGLPLPQGNEYGRLKTEEGRIEVFACGERIRIRDRPWAGRRPLRGDANLRDRPRAGRRPLRGRGAFLRAKPQVCHSEEAQPTKNLMIQACAGGEILRCAQNDSVTDHWPLKSYFPACTAASLRSRRCRTSSLLGRMSPALVSAHLVMSGPTSS